MEAFKCDLCGHFYEPYNYYANEDQGKPNTIDICNKSASGYVEILARHDLCPECMHAFENFIKERQDVKI